MEPKPQAGALGTPGQLILTSGGLSGQAPPFLPRAGPLLQPPVTFQARPHFAFPTFLLTAQTPSARPGEADGWGGVSQARGTRKGVLGVGGMSVQARSDREGRKGLPILHIPNPAPHSPPPHLRLRLAPQCASPSIRPLFGVFPSHLSRDPCPVPPGPATLGRAALITPAPRSRPALFPRPAGMPGSPTFPGSPRPEHQMHPPAPLAPSSSGPARPLFPSKPLRETASLLVPQPCISRGPPVLT